MTRDDLLLVLARELYDRQESEPWDRATLGRQESYLLDAADMAEPLVAFVAEWLESTGSATSFLSGRWREEMGGG